MPLCLNSPVFVWCLIRVVCTAYFLQQAPIVPVIRHRTFAPINCTAVRQGAELLFFECVPTTQPNMALSTVFEPLAHNFVVQCGHDNNFFNLAGRVGSGGFSNSYTWYWFFISRVGSGRARKFSHFLTRVGSGGVCFYALTRIGSPFPRPDLTHEVFPDQ